MLTYFIVVLLVLTTVGCSRQRVYDRVLADADSIIEQRADPAYALLRQIPDAADRGDEASRAHYALLLTQAAYKLSLPRDSMPADSLIRSAVSYYERTGDQHLLCRALYYRAMPLYEQGRHDEALLLLKRGEELATSIHDVLYMAKYHESLCMVNDYANSHDLMLKYAKLFLDDAILLEDSCVISRAFSHIFVAYFKIEEYEEAKKYILRSLPLFHALKNSSKAYILTNIACIFHQEGDLRSARLYLEKSLKVSPMFNTYAELGDVHADEGNYIEAEKYWEKALNADSPTIVMNTLASMFNQYKKQHDYAKALTIAEQIHHLKDSLGQVSELAMLTEIQYKYDRKVVENKYYKALTWTFGLALLLVTISLCYYLYHRHTVKAFTNQLSVKEEAILNAQRQIAELENSGEEHSEEIKTLQRDIENIRRQTNERLGIGKAAYDCLLADGHLTPKDDIHCLIEYYSILHYDTYHEWNEEYKKLTARDYTLLIMRAMGKTDAETEQALRLSHNAFRAAKSRLNSKRIQQ